MAHSPNPDVESPVGARAEVLNGAAMAAFVAAGVGTFALGLFVILNEAGFYTAPSLYGPAGGVSGRTTFGVLVWLAAWGVLHARWKSKRLDASPQLAVTVVLIVLGLVMMFPPVWGLVASE
jgi:hypothetical protein